MADFHDWLGKIVAPDPARSNDSGPLEDLHSWAASWLAPPDDGEAGGIEGMPATFPTGIQAPNGHNFQGKRKRAPSPHTQWW